MAGGTPALPGSALRFLRLALALLITVHCLLFIAYPAEPPNELSQIQNTNLHQWGAVTLFHGLPSDRVRAIAQTADGTMWFGTDGGLARYDGRRTQAVVDDGLPQGVCLRSRWMRTARSG